ncbi:Mth938-like domain-containing protein [Parachitinimonas caeni]|uniref:Mth938-like domain-containing protein n=1 Tax=Parachitinimonas caeni TaxID=3031301 RepID=A0ABT7DTH6_9NEIS|nr:Mth938-like domain-containing protein [Parachitinimonas caeni]MDK2123358.1 Mth938-like domain-containing protein [Parachitinimonas caeni]
MKLQSHALTHLNTFTGYGDDFVMINAQRHTGSMLVMPERMAPWRPDSFDALQAEDFAELIAFKPELVLLATGSQQRFPHPRLTSALMQAQIGLDAMNLGAACRTYNILMSEGRQVLLAVLYK